MTPEIRKIARTVFLFALIVRLAWCTLATVTPISDCAGYNTLARELLKTGRFHYGMGDAWRTPGYPGFMAGVYAVLGDNARAVALVQAFLGALSAAAVVLIASQVASPRASLLAGVFQALWPTAVVYTPVLVAENLATPLILLSLVCVAWARRASGWRALTLVVVAGVIFGLLLLTRPANCFFAPALLLLLVYDLAQRKWRVAAPLVFVGVTMVVLAPWLIRNNRLGLGPFVLSTEGGLGMWWGNNPQSHDGGDPPPRFPEEDHLSEREREEFYRAKVIAWLRDNPGRYLALSGVRAARFLGKPPDWFAAKFAWPTPENDAAVGQRFEATLTGKNLTKEHVVYAEALEARHMKYEERLRRIVAPLMLLAFVWSLFRWRTFALVSLPALFYFLGFSLTVFVERYRVPSDPLFLILLAVLLSDIVFGTRDLGGGRAARVVKGALAILLIVASTYVHKTHVDRGWYTLSPREQPPAATRPGVI
jgi:4-amino-4-deoxy-L-arabinose transferase-like glycosyltransferase